MEINSFAVSIPQADIDDLHRRIDCTRWPDQLNDSGWTFGTERGYLRDLVSYWRSGFDWSRFEARMNQFPQYLARFGGLSTHFLHMRSSHEDATPLLLTHGWPGSIAEFLDVIPRLSQPERFGGNPKDACHVVCPSLPGFGFSEAAHVRGLGPKQIAARHLSLMAALGYERFVAQGGDWGAIISRFLPELARERLLGLHLNFIVPTSPKGIGQTEADALCTPEERKALEQYKANEFDNFGYAAIQGSRPQTLGYAMADSPVGLCGWITEKFRAWTDNDSDLREAVSWDFLLGNISLYWFTNSITSSMRLYREYYDRLAAGSLPETPVTQPFAAAVYPREIVRAPRAWIEREYNLVQWFEAKRGGHFAALEQPKVFSDDIQQFIAKIKERATVAIS